MLITATKDWLANNAGLSGCFAGLGVSYTDPDGISRTGGTGDVLNAFYVAHLLGKDSQAIKAGATYTSLKAINGGNDLALDDVSWAYSNDGSPTGETKYCASVATPTPSPTQPVGTFEFATPPSGTPTVNMNLSGLVMRQNTTDQHFEMNVVNITNTSQWPIYLAAEVRLFQGILSSCPSTGEVFRGLDRVSTTRAPRIRSLAVGESANFNLDFYQPTSIVGVHTICLAIHGSYDSDALDAEIAGISG